MVDFWKNDPVHEFWKNDEVVPFPQPSQRPSDAELTPPKQWQPTRGASPATNKMGMSISDIPGAPQLLAATNLGGSDEDLPDLQKHLTGIAEQERNVPETEYSKSRKEGKGYFESVAGDFPGYVTNLKESAKQGIIPMAGALAGSLAGPAGAVVGLRCAHRP